MKRSPLKRKTPLRKQSKRRKEESKEYMRKRDHFLFMHPICQIWLEQNCWADNGDGTYTDTGTPSIGRYSANELIEVFRAPRSEVVHHRCCGKNRKATYLRVDTWMALNTLSHDFIHKNPKLAYERGWLLKTIPEEPKCED